MLDTVTFTAYHGAMTSNQIRAALILRGITAASIARRLKVSRAAVSAEIGGKRTSARIRKAIVRAIGHPNRTPIFPNP